MSILKRFIWIVFGISWIVGVLVTAPIPLYRWVFIRTNGYILDTPHRVFGGADWDQPNVYARASRALRTLSQNSSHDTLYLYFDPHSDINTDDYTRHFYQYARVWVYPKQLEYLDDLNDLPDNISFVISSDTPPDFDCIVGEENLYLCQS